MGKFVLHRFVDAVPPPFHEVLMLAHLAQALPAFVRPLGLVIDPSAHGHLWIGHAAVPRPAFRQEAHHIAAFREMRPMCDMAGAQECS